MTSLALQEGCHLDYRGKLASVRTIEPDFVVLEIDGSCQIIQPSQLYQDMADGLAETHKPSVMLVKSSPLTTPHERALAKKYQDYLTALDNEEFPCSPDSRSRVIEQVAAERGDAEKNKPSISTLYNWYKEYTSERINRNIAAMVTPRTRKQGRQASQEALDIFWQIINEHYLRREDDSALCVDSCFKLFKPKWAAYVSNLDIAELKKIKGICRSIFYKLVDDIDPVEVDTARKGSAYAQNKYRNVTEHFVTFRPLELVQIDAVHINLGIRDNDGNYIGMPVVFFAIDVFTRAILGYVISIAKKRGEDLCSAIDLIKCSIQPKKKPDHTENGWPLSGKFEWLQHDSGIFSSHQFAAFLFNAQIEIYQNPAKKAWFNAYIERFNSTFRQRCCEKIPGYQGKRDGEYKDSVNVESVAHTTKDQFKKIVEAFILDNYHQTPHRGLGNISPADMCKQHQGFVSIPKSEYIQRINSFRGIEFEATIQGHKGIGKNTVYYNDKAKKLQKLFIQLGGKKGRNNPKVKAFYSDIDISKISVFNPFTDEVFDVPCTSIKEPMSWAELQARNKGIKKSENTSVDTMSPIVAEINDFKAEKQAKKDKKKAEIAKKKTEAQNAENQLNEPPTPKELNVIIEENNAGINAPPPASETPSKPEPDHDKPRSIGRTRNVKPIRI